MSDFDTKELSRHEYWDARYRAGDEHEWFMEYVDLRSLLDRLLPPAETSSTILHLGCGTSSLTKDLYEVGYHKQLNIDFSQQAIDMMQKRFTRDGVSWLVGDVRHMGDIESGTVDVAIDKGTLDAMLNGSLYDPPEEVSSNVTAYIDEVARVLSPRGRFVYVTWRSPLFMRKFVERTGVWDYEVHTLQKAAGSLDYCCYCLTKGTPTA